MHYIYVYVNSIVISYKLCLHQIFITAATVEQNFGKLNITESSSDGFYCETVYFPNAFRSGGTVRVFPSVSHEDHPGNGNEASVAEITSVDQNSFSICLLEPAQPTGEMTLNWFAFSDSILPSGTLAGSVSYNTFTSGSSCNDVTFSRVSFHDYAYTHNFKVKWCYYNQFGQQ